jgi:Uma2 family endonuclease
MITNPVQQVQSEVREIVNLLMQRPITEEIALRVEAIEGFEHLEVMDGEWVGFGEDEYMAGEEHGRLEYKLILRLGNHVEQHKLGMLYTGDTDFVLDGEPGNIRVKPRPDIAFVASSRLKKSKGYIHGAPDLAVEIISPTERPGQIQKKLGQYLEFGVKQVWHVYPDSREIVVHFPDNTSKTYRVSDTISGGDLLPGFTLNVGQLFED